MLIIDRTFLSSEAFLLLVLRRKDICEEKHDAPVESFLCQIWPFCYPLALLGGGDKMYQPFFLKQKRKKEAKRPAKNAKGYQNVLRLGRKT